MNKWNYAEMQNKENYFGSQKDWNQTLISMINQVSDKKYPTTLLVSRNLKPLIKTLLYYNEPDLGKLSEKYYVEFIDSSDNIITIDDKQLLIENYI